jgi:uncharacterized protein
MSADEETLTPVILDTNVFVAAGFNPKSSSAKIVEAVRQGRLPMVWNEATRRETEMIMRKIPPLRAKPIDDLFRAEHRYDGPTHPERFSEVPDPDDRKFAALAHATGATVVSNDEDLLGYSGPLELTVLMPGEFWKRYKDEG